jgi:hypothetical protein
LKAERGDDRLRHLEGILHGRKRDPPDTIGVVLRQISSRPKGHTGLADPARPGEREQPSGPEAPLDRGKFIPPSHETGEFGGQVCQGWTRTW